MTEHPLTRVSGEYEPDPVVLAYERDEAWRVMQYHVQKAAEFEKSFVNEKNFRRKVEIKANGFDRLASVLAELVGSGKELRSTFPYLLDIVRQTNIAFERMNDSLARGLD